MDDEFAAFAAKICDEAARCSVELFEAQRLLMEALDEGVSASWVARAEKHLRGDLR